MDDRVRIVYPDGEMELVLSMVFPCTAREGRIVFPLINGYAEDTEKEKLRHYLQAYTAERETEIREMEAKHRVGREYRHERALYKRAVRNLNCMED